MDLRTDNSKNCITAWKKYLEEQPVLKKMYQETPQV